MTFKEWKEKYGSDSEAAKMAKNQIPPTDEFIKSIAEKRRKPYTVGKEGEDRFYDDNGKPICPPKDGVVGEEKKTTLHKGEIISRYGADTGRFASPRGTELEARAFSREAREVQELHEYEVISEIACFKGIVAPWFNPKGGGIQYRFEKRIFELVEDKVLIEKNIQHSEAKG